MKEKSVKTKLERLFGHLRENMGRSNYKSVKKGRYPPGNGESLSIVDLKLLKLFFWDGVTFIGICGILLFKKILMSIYFLISKIYEKYLTVLNNYPFAFSV